MSAAQKLGEQMQICPDNVQLILTAPELVCVSELLAGNEHVLSLTVHSQPGVHQFHCRCMVSLLRFHMALLLPCLHIIVACL